MDELTSDSIRTILKEQTNLIKFNFDTKSDEASSKIRSKANELLFSNSDLSKIYKLYNKSLFHAKSSIQQAYSLGNRSNILFKTGLYKECLVDIEKAFQLGYPDSKRLKLLVRKAESLLMLSSFNEALMIFNLILKDNFEINDQWLMKINSGIEKCKTTSMHNNLIKSFELRDKYPIISDDLLTFKRCTNASSFCEKVSVKYNKNDGRGVFSRGNLEIGDIICYDNPWSLKLTEENFLTHCFTCLKRCFNLLPCERCNRVGFCNSCDDETHKLNDCGYITDILSTPAHDLGLLAIETVLKVGIDHYETFVKQHITEKQDVMCEKFGDDYLSVLRLVTNEERRNEKDKQERYNVAIVLALCVQKKQGIEMSEETLILLCYSLLQHLQAISCNAHSLSMLTLPSLSLQYTANALYPALSLLNHSCSPNVLRITLDNGVCMLKVLQPITEGEQLLDNYSIHYATEMVAHRKEKLNRQYLFDCMCTPCTENWPTFQELLKKNEPVIFHCPNCESSTATILTPQNNFTCINPHVDNQYKTQCESINKLYSQITDIINSIMMVETLPSPTVLNTYELLLIDLQKLAHTFVKPPSLILNQVTEVLKMVWNIQNSCCITEVF